MRILVIRLGAMGDLFHVMPAVAALRRGYPDATIEWAVEPKWRYLIDGHPAINGVVEIRRSSWADAARTARMLRARRFDLAVDFQGLIKSAVVAWFGGRRRVGLSSEAAREGVAAWAYHQHVTPRHAHIVDRNLEVALAAGGADGEPAFWAPDGSAEGQLPEGRFLLGSPAAGWGSKQWPIDRWIELARRAGDELGLPLVLNVLPGATIAGPRWVHGSTLAGLVDATRRASAVVGLDSGPLHLAAALGKPGVAIFGPTDPARNGPYRAPMTVLRSAAARTSYRHVGGIDESMLEVSVDEVIRALRERLSV